MRRAAIFFLSGLLFAGMGLLPAQAHKVIASVFANGDVIEGEIGFSNGDMASDALVEVFDEDGAKLGEAITDSDGFFIFTPSKRVVHVFKANLGAGHIAQVRMELEDLPEIGPTANTDGGEETGAGSQNARPPALQQAARTVEEPAGQASLAALEENREQLRQMIHKEVTPLRREIAAYKEKNDFQTILGGIGYIAGLFGLFFYLAARRKLAQAEGLA